MTAIDIGIVGAGKVARDRHLPAIAAGDAFRLAATADPGGGIPEVENHGSLQALLAARPEIGALAICTPPQMRFAAALAALRAGRHVMLEKPPCASLAAVLALQAVAAERGVTLFAAWHSRFAPGVAAAKAWCAANPPRHVRIIWHEDVRRWHPDQQWIWQPGGFGVFDPGINALSILTEILPEPVHVTGAELSLPENRATPIAAALRLQGPGVLSVEADFDWRPEGEPVWQIQVAAGRGHLALSAGGACLEIDGLAAQLPDASDEYDALYRRFAALVAACAVEVDVAPLVHVADAFMLGSRLAVAPFHD